jgi:hypothetical protein
MTKKTTIESISITKYFTYIIFISIMICAMIQSQIYDFKKENLILARPFTIVKALGVNCDVY